MGVVKKKDEELNEQELLVQLVKSEKRNRLGNFFALSANIMIILVLAAVCILVLPRFEHFLSLMKEVEELTLQAEQSLANIDEAVELFQTVVEDARPEIKEGFEKLNSIDVDALNDGIEDLGGVVGKLNGAMTFFGGGK